MSTRLPIRWRLTLWYAAFLIGSAILLGSGFYLGTRSLLFGFFQEQLEKQSALALSSVRTDAGTLTIDANTVANLRDDEHFVRLLDPSGTALVDTSASVGPVSVSPLLARDALDGKPSVAQARTPEGTILIKASPVRSGESIVGVLQVGASRGDIEDVLRILMIGLVVAVPIVLLLAGGGGYIIAGRALAPVTAITELASSIGPRVSAAGWRSICRTTSSAAFREPSTRCWRGSSRHLTANADSLGTPLMNCARPSPSCVVRSISRCAGLGLPGNTRRRSRKSISTLSD